MLFAKDFLTDQKVLRSEESKINPLVSVILPTYCRGKTGQLERSLSSVLAQTFPDFELLIMDDGSSDGSYDLIEKLRFRDSRVVHVRHERNSGIHSIRLNEGMTLARGKYITFQFDDDLWTPIALESLVGESARHNEPVFVIGHSLITGLHGKWNIPVVEVNLINLLEQNRFANNSVLFPRLLVEQYGMYDPHIGMRRLCDWDLWLRYIKQVPFIVIDPVVSEVFESNPNSLGVTVPWDLPLFRFISDIQRDQLLTPQNWLDYPIDSLAINGVEIPKDIQKRLYENQIVPYYFKFRHHHPKLEGFSAALPHAASKAVLYTKHSYDTTYDVALQHYDQITSRRGTYKGFYQPLLQLSEGWSKDTDILVLNRVVEDKGQKLIEEALQNNIPLAYYMDDDLLHFFEYGPQFNYIAPGTPFHNNLKSYLAQVDTVITTNEAIASGVRPINPRVILHNGSVPSEALPRQINERLPDKPLCIGYVGGGYRIEEFKFLWDAFVQLSEEFSSRVVFEFWGMDLSALPPLACPVSYRPFIFNYPRYIKNLKQAGFDVLVTPLFDYPRPRLAKSYNKYYETAVAGALGIFSDVPQYQRLPGGLTCLKAENTSQAWYQALCVAVEMPLEEFDSMRARYLEHVREEFTAEGQIHYHEAALRATEFHAKTRPQRQSDDRPRVVYALHSASFGGAEILLWRRLHLAREYGIEPVIFLPLVTKETPNGKLMKETLDQEGIRVEFLAYACFTEPHSPEEYYSEAERSQIQALLDEIKPALVHSITFIPSLGQVCQELCIPHVTTQYAIEDAFAWKTSPKPFTHCQVVQSDSYRYAERWSRLLNDTSKVVARDMTPIDLFELGQRRYLESLGKPQLYPSHPIQMVVAGTYQPRKQQVEAIEAVGRLVKEGLDCQLFLYGYTHFFPDYMEKCKQTILRWNLEDRVVMREFTLDMVSILQSADILLSPSNYEGLPGAIRDAFAAGVLVVATPVGGVKELVIDGISGILCTDISVEAIMEGINRACSLSPIERDKIIQQARRVARSESHPYRTANDLMYMYNLAIDLTRSGSQTAKLGLPAPGKPSQVTPPSRKIIHPHAAPTGAVQVGAGLVVYPFTPSHPAWDGLDVLIGTHMRPASGKLKLNIHAGNGMLLRQVCVGLSQALDNDWLGFQFPPITNSADTLFCLEFKLENPGPKTMISIYETNPVEGRLRRIFWRVLRTFGLPINRNGLYCRHYYHNNQNG
jgi:glycosyltransferase involved in cell wall biosynthesis